LRWEWGLYFLVIAGAVWELRSVRRSIRADREAARKNGKAPEA
jgi:hypothetical protein